MNAKVSITDNGAMDYGLALLLPNGEFHTMEISYNDYKDLERAGVPWNPFEF